MQILYIHQPRFSGNLVFSCRTKAIRVTEWRHVIVKTLVFTCHSTAFTGYQSISKKNRQHHCSELQAPIVPGIHPWRRASVVSLQCRKHFHAMTSNITFHCHRTQTVDRNYSHDEHKMATASGKCVPTFSRLMNVYIEPDWLKLLPSIWGCSTQHRS